MEINELIKKSIYLFSNGKLTAIANIYATWRKATQNGTLPAIEWRIYTRYKPF